jgi:glycosyltransferase involved in cell wall biosynthesis
MYRDKSVSVVLPTYNEKDSIAGVIRGFEALGVVDEIIVVNNNAAPGTSEEVAGTSAREVVESVQGYGAAIRRGLREAQCDLIAVCEPDGTFDPDDLFKLLTYTKESDFVVGSRTVSTFIWDGANMGWFLQFGNWTVAKMIEASFNTTSLSDVGCTFRVISRDLARILEPEFQHTGSAFGLEMLLLATRRHVRVVQIPVNYLPRVGESSVTGDFRKTLSLGFRVIGMVGRARASRVSPLPVQYRRPTWAAHGHGSDPNVSA